MIQSFKDQGTEDIFNGVKSRSARNTCPEALREIAARKLDLLDSAESIRDLQIPPGNRLERLSGRRQGQHSIRINDQYRICIIWSANGPGQVTIVDYH